MKIIIINNEHANEYMVYGIRYTRHQSNAPILWNVVLVIIVTEHFLKEFNQFNIGCQILIYFLISADFDVDFETKHYEQTWKSIWRIISLQRKVPSRKEKVFHFKRNSSLLFELYHNLSREHSSLNECLN